MLSFYLFIEINFLQPKSMSFLSIQNIFFSYKSDLDPDPASLILKALLEQRPVSLSLSFWRARPQNKNWSLVRRSPIERIHRLKSIHTNQLKCIPPPTREKEKKSFSTIIIHILVYGSINLIEEEGLNQKTRQRSLRLFGGQNTCRASCFASVQLEQTVEFNSLFQIDWLSSTVCGAKQLARQGFCPRNRGDDLCLVF